MGCAGSSNTKPTSQATQQERHTQTQTQQQRHQQQRHQHQPRHLQLRVVAPTAPPYHGPKCEYHFENFLVPFQMDSNCSFLTDSNVPMTTFSTGVYEPVLHSLYANNLRLLSFSATPGSITSGALMGNVQHVSKCQAICRRIQSEENGEKYSLKVVKSMLPAQVFTYGMFRVGNADSSTNTHHIIQTLFDETSRGARLISIEISGGNAQYVPQTTMTQSASNPFMSMSLYGHNPAMILGVDMFFEIPQFADPPKYAYECVTVPFVAEFNIEFMSAGKWNVWMDWQTVVQQYLTSGWRLVDIFLDQNNSSFTDRPIMATKVTMNLNCIFIFEKKESDLSNSTQLYEANMIEYHAPCTMEITGFSQCKVTCNIDWEATIIQMGTEGWELVRALETPAFLFEMQLSFTPKGKKVMWMFFQRKVVKEPEQVAVVKEPEQNPVEPWTDEKPPEVVLPQNA